MAKFMLRVPDGEVDSLFSDATVVHNLMTMALWASKKDMHGVNGQVGSRVVRRILGEHPSMGLKRGRGRAREGDGEHYNPWGLVYVGSHRVFPQVIVPDDIIGGGREAQSFQYGLNEKQGCGVEEVVWVRMGLNVTGGRIRLAFCNDGARY